MDESAVIVVVHLNIMVVLLYDMHVQQVRPLPAGNHVRQRYLSGIPGMSAQYVSKFALCAVRCALCVCVFVLLFDTAFLLSEVFISACSLV